LTGTGCLFCHQSPHPGRQDDCLSCHDFDGWRVGLATISGKNGR
jgi:cytochrome c551/c552